MSVSEPDFEMVPEVVDRGRDIGEGNWNTVYEAPGVPGFESSVVKVFYRIGAGETYRRVRGVGPLGVPRTEVGVADLSTSGYGEETVVVVQERSDYPLTEAERHGHTREDMQRDLVELSDTLVMNDVVPHDMKLRDCHYFNGELRWVDHEDRESYRKYPDDYVAPNPGHHARQDLVNHYFDLSGQTALHWGLEVGDAMETIADHSEILELDGIREGGSLRDAVPGDMFAR